MHGRQLLQYIIDVSDIVLVKKQEATEYLAKLEAEQQSRQSNFACTCGNCSPLEYNEEFCANTRLPIQQSISLDPK